MVESYKDNVKHLTQQKGSQLRKCVQVESVTGKNHYFEQIGATSMRQRTSRHADTPRMDVPHSRRRVSLTDYDWAELVDNEDKVRMLIDPTSPYAEAAAMAAGRQIDDIIIAAADATAYTGVDGTTTQAFDSGMIVDVQTRWPGVSADDCGLNVAKIIEARRLLGRNNVDPSEEKYMIVNEDQIASLIKDDRISSGDYNIVKPLVDGIVTRFGGFNIIPCNRIGRDENGDDKVLFWAKGGLALAVGADITTRISERADKNYATQVFCSMIMGATRLEEVRVGYIECDPDGGPTGALD
jgi:hypothetical protein